MPTLEKELWQSEAESQDLGYDVLPTLEKELWQSLGGRASLFFGSCRHWKRNCGKAIRPHRPRETASCRHWKRNCGKAASIVKGMDVASSCRHWKRNCGKADVGNCTTIRGVMSNFATDFGWILGRMGNLRGLRGEWPRGGVESVCGWVVKDRGRCTVRIG